MSGTWPWGNVGQGKLGWCDIDSGLVGLHMKGVLLKSSSLFYFPFLHIHLSLFNSFQFFAEIPFSLCMLATFLGFCLISPQSHIWVISRFGSLDLTLPLLMLGYISLFPCLPCFVECQILCVRA